MKELTIPQQKTMQQSIADVSQLLHGMLNEYPTFTGSIEIHIKDGVALEANSKKRYKLIK